MMCTVDVATMVHSDICPLLNGDTLGKNKKTRKTKGSYPDPSKTIENNKNKKLRSQPPWETSGFDHAFSHIIAKNVDFGNQLNILLPEYGISAVIRKYGVQTSPKVAEILAFWFLFLLVMLGSG